MRWYRRGTANRSGSPFCALLVYLLATSWLPGQENIQFRDVGLESGLQLRHQCLGEAPLLPRLMVAGMAMFDYDSDGWLDIYLLNQGTLPLESLDQQDKAPLTDKKQAAFAPIGNRLYRNNRDGTYSDVTMLAGVASGQFCLGVVAADVDNDGDSDLLLNNFGSVEFYQNNGDGTFESATKGSMIEGPAGQFGAGIACLDIDHDGALDIYASNYVDFTMERYRDRAEKSFPYPPGPKDFAPSPDRLLRNLGNGTFEDVSVSSGVAGFPGPTMGVICGDFDGDGDCDIFLCSDAAPNQLLVNDGRGKFTDQAVASGVVFDVSGNVNGSMGVDAGDYDNDGRSTC